MWRSALFKLFKKSLPGFVVCGIVSAPLAAAEPTASTQSPPMPVVLQVFEERSATCQKLLSAVEESEWSVLYNLYQPQGFTLLWDNTRIGSLLKQLELLADDGLDPSFYQPERLRNYLNTPNSEESEQSCNDVLVTHAYLTALKHLAFGRLNRARLEPLWYAEGTQKDPQQQLLQLATQGLNDPTQAFNRARPHLDLYVNLRTAYATLRRQPPTTPGKNIPEGPSLHIGEEDARVPLIDQLLRRAGVIKTSTLPKGSLLYSDVLAEAVSRFQAQQNLTADGVFGEGTRLALNAGNVSNLDQVRLNLERLRWIAYEMEPTSLLVDVVGARLIYYRNNQPIWWTRVQVGQPERPTPLLKSLINRVTLNPTWTVPPTILREDKLPKIRQSPEYLRQHKLQVLNQQGQVVDPNSVNWNNPQGIRLRQEAGVGNPLGRVVVRFDNPFSVYLHDTPSQHLFSRAARAFSSGCVRVEGALQLVDRLVTDEERPTIERLLESGKTHHYRLNHPLSILMGYWTAEADAKGQVRYRADVYTKDPSVLTALLTHRF